MDGQAIIGQTISDPWMYLAVIAVGIIAFGLRALVRGDLGTGREIVQKDARIEYLEQALRTRDAQVDDALEVLPKIADVLAELHPAKAVEQS